MSNVFITFLGLGNPNSKEGELGYDSLSYEFEDKKSYTTPFAQRATVEWIGVPNIDKYLVLLTAESREKHWKPLLEEWQEIGVDTSAEADKITEIDISTNQNKTEQWKWFEKLFQHIEKGDTLYFDFTHGFRSVPIIFSTAIGFLQKGKQVLLKHAFYGYLEDKKQKTGNVIDLVDFYRINDWADGVSALVESADPSKLNRLAEEEGDTSPFKAITDKNLIRDLDNLNLKIRSVDVENVGSAAAKAFKQIERLRDPDSHTPDQYLLEMLVEKFAPLAQFTPKTYNSAYFDLQLKLIKVLFAHRFHMQAFTAMRELIGTIGLAGLLHQSIEITKLQKDHQRTYADLFFNMCQYREKKWKFETMAPKIQERFQILRPFWNKMTPDTRENLYRLSSSISTLRNGFDHAWLGKKGVPQDVAEQCEELFGSLEQIIAELTRINIIKKKE